MRKNQKRIAIVIVVLVSLSMIAPSFMLLYSSSSNSNAVYPTTTTSTSTLQTFQSQVDSLTQAVKANPEDVSTRLNLANAYYDLAMATLSDNAPDKASPIFMQAVSEYQEVAKSQKDVNVLVDMATAAFYGGDNDIADKTFKEALAMKPDFLNALLNYGFFLMSAKNDYMGAIAQWNTALIKANPSPADEERLRSFISMAQEQLQSTFEKSGSVNNSDSTTPEAK